jgi:hypothetical protein
MKKTTFLAVLTVLSFSAPAMAQTYRWVDDTAHTLPEGQWEIGLFGPLRYGLTEKVELTANPLLFFLMPHATAKVGLVETDGWKVAVRHGLTYPTPMLRLFAREGIGGIIPAHQDIPHIIALNNELLVSKLLGGDHQVTWKVGVQVAPRFGDSTWTTLDLPLLYGRTAAYHSYATGRMGVDFHGTLIGPLDYAVDADVFVMPGLEGNYAVEHGARLTMNFSERFVLQGGYKMIYGGYPFGRQFHMLPVVELQWARR